MINIKYILRNGMELHASIPKKDNKIFKELIGIYKSNTEIKYPGNIVVSLAENNNLDFIYSLEEGSGSYESEIRVLNEDESTTNYEVEFKLRTRNKPDHYSEKLYERYYTNESVLTEQLSCSTISTPPTGFENIIPTRVEIIYTDRNLNSQKISMSLNDNEKSKTMKTEHNSIFKCTANFRSHFLENNKNLRFVDRVVIETIKSPSFIGPEYFSVQFVDFINKETEQNIDIKEIVYYKINNRQINTIYDEDESIKVPSYSGFEQPEGFLQGEVTSPAAPYDESYENPINENNVGDAFINTMAHKEFAPDGTRSIKIGKTVPPNAVNLAYYYNKTASFDNALSVIETNSNSITLKRMEQWKHYKRLPKKDSVIFQETVEFNGEKGTELEGFWGILYKEKVIFDEEVDLDQDPEFICLYERYSGRENPNAPLKRFYKDNNKYGKLTLVHMINHTTNFEKGNEFKSGYLPVRHEVNAKYEGFIKLKTILYNVSVKYSGIITKKDGMSNLDPEQPRELIMFPNKLGVLEDSSGNSKIDDDLFLITDKFCDEEPLYYKHRLKFYIYNSIGKDKYGNFDYNNIKLVFSNGVELNKNKYKYAFDIEKTLVENVYIGYIYTNFMTTFEAPVYVIYDCLMEGLEEFTKYGPQVKIGMREPLSLIEAIDKDMYSVKIEEGFTRQSEIIFDDFLMIDDNRFRIPLKYHIECNGLRSKKLSFDILNKKYALIDELKDYVNDDKIISPRSNNGYYTARDLLFENLTDLEIATIKPNHVFKAIYDTTDFTTNTNKDKAILFTSTDGLDVVYSKSFYETGFPSDDSNNPVYNRALDKNSIYISKDGKIFKGYSVKCKNINQIVISSPKEKDPLKGWFPKVRYSYFSKVYERIDKTIQLIYSVPEFNTQVFGKYGAPYIDVKKEKARIVSKNTIKTVNPNIYIKQNLSFYPDTISVYKIGIDGIKKNLHVKSFDYINGIIELEDAINDNDNVFIDYSYEERFYHYKGYYRDGNKDSKLININLNPSMYYKYTDTKNELYDERQTYDLFNRTIHFFLRPTRVIDKETGEVLTDNKFTLYHKFDDQKAEGPFDLHIGRIFIRHHASSKSTEIIDTRSRGGGVLEEISDSLRRELEPESDFYLDISTFDGKPFQANSVVVIKISNQLLKINGGKYTEDDIKIAATKWCAIGMLPIVEFVSVINNEDLPNSTIVVNKHIDNLIDITPEFSLEVIEQ